MAAGVFTCLCSAGAQPQRFATCLFLDFEGQLVLEKAAHLNFRREYERSDSRALEQQWQVSATLRCIGDSTGQASGVRYTRAPRSLHSTLSIHHLQSHVAACFTDSLRSSLVVVKSREVMDLPRRRPPVPSTANPVESLQNRILNVYLARY